jgi:hypothetical protein
MKEFIRSLDPVDWIAITGIVVLMTPVIMFIWSTLTT